MVEIEEAVGHKTMSQVAQRTSLRNTSSLQLSGSLSLSQIRKSQDVAGVTTPNMHQPSKGKKGAKRNGGIRTAQSIGFANVRVVPGGGIEPP